MALNGVSVDENLIKMVPKNKNFQFFPRIQFKILLMKTFSLPEKKMGQIWAYHATVYRFLAIFCFKGKRRQKKQQKQQISKEPTFK